MTPIVAGIEIVAGIACGLCGKRFEGTYSAQNEKMNAHWRTHSIWSRFWYWLRFWWGR